MKNARPSSVAGAPKPPGLTATAAGGRSCCLSPSAFEPFELPRLLCSMRFTRSRMPLAPADAFLEPPMAFTLDCPLRLRVARRTTVNESAAMAAAPLMPSAASTGVVSTMALSPSAGPLPTSIGGVPSPGVCTPAGVSTVAGIPGGGGEGAGLVPPLPGVYLGGGSGGSGGGCGVGGGAGGGLGLAIASSSAVKLASSPRLITASRTCADPAAVSRRVEVSRAASPSGTRSTTPRSTAT